MDRRRFVSRLTGAATALGTASWVGGSWAADGALSATHITIGSSLALSGMLGGSGADYVNGMKAAFEVVNRNGGIHGRELRLQALDDGYVPARTAANVKQMLDSGQVFSLISIMGTANNAAVLPMIEQQGVPCVGPITGAGSLRHAKQRWVFYVRPSYQDEVLRVVPQLVQMGLQGIGIVYLDNPFGKEVLEAAERTLSNNKLQAVGAFALAVDGSNASQVAQQVFDARAGAVLMGTTGGATTKLVLALRGKAAALPLLGVSVAVTAAEVPKLGRAAQGIAQALVFPDASSAKSAAVRNFHSALRTAKLDNGEAKSVESWINAQLLIEGLRRAGRDLTRERLRAALAGIRELDVGEFMLGFQGSAPFVASNSIKIGVFDEGGRLRA
ncbi:ABC transporter substrate-binding protein [Aquabacterium sp. A7-Y]|uniref:ABC transporter substrate-binding protein n=1 Tax=Aquabacterium sp. A7-Y TaxID=1349605 RepID=UPI00223CB6FC|nr:ABC transporter substrate-binding protein [Aquabacterium sp. A7-Y]MCW7539675.1 ABC transporter substrate-binding protein [Aquabacterium sp. A7-Y]